MTDPEPRTFPERLDAAQTEGEFLGDLVGFFDSLQAAREEADE